MKNVFFLFWKKLVFEKKVLEKNMFLKKKLKKVLKQFFFKVWRLKVTVRINKDVDGYDVTVYFSISWFLATQNISKRVKYKSTMHGNIGNSISLVMLAIMSFHSLITYFSFCTNLISLVSN